MGKWASDGEYIDYSIFIKERTHKTIQTHNAVSVAASGTSASAWIDVEGYEKLAITFLNEAATTSSANVEWSNDGATVHGTESNVIASNTSANKVGETTPKARYVRLVVSNGDTVAHTISAWAYLRT
jgi:hypothetical protein